MTNSLKSFYSLYAYYIPGEGYIVLISQLLLFAQ